jgi:hypothetical protein
MAFDPLSSAGIGSAVASAEEAIPVIEALLGSTSRSDRQVVAEARAAAEDVRWAVYRERLLEAYGSEARWHRSAFWARRRDWADATVSLTAALERASPVARGRN